ncbi:MAG TPA: hypothetical protein VLH84_01045 [Patescibacteria group bacterium]|nr:hypothetical protein [Patescibacteria group bacterium]
MTHSETIAVATAVGFDIEPCQVAPGPDGAAGAAPSAEKVVERPTLARYSVSGLVVLEHDKPGFAGPFANWAASRVEREYGVKPPTDSSALTYEHRWPGGGVTYGNGY